jgi:hypothetical protein
MKTMKQYLFLLGVLMLVASRLTAQINFVFLPDIYGRTVDGLGNFQMQNLTGQAVRGKVSITVQENISKTQVLIIVSPLFVVNPGTMAFPLTVYAGGSFNFTNAPIAAIASQTRNFPPGEYTYCYRFITAETHEEDESCFDANIQPLVPISLIYPADEDKICQKRPPLSWQPPVPLPSNMLFRLELTQKRQGMADVEALTMNAPLILLDNIPSTTVSYPSYAPDLQEDSTYCWQVIAFQNWVIMSRSEIWEFTVQCSDSVKPASDDNYRELKTNVNGNYYYAFGVLKFSYQNKYNLKKLVYEIYETEGTSDKIKNLPDIPLVHGYNKVDIDLSDLDLEAGKHYMLKVYPFNEPPVVVIFVYQVNNAANP